MQIRMHWKNIFNLTEKKKFSFNFTRGMDKINVKKNSSLYCFSSSLQFFSIAIFI